MSAVGGDAMAGRFRHVATFGCVAIAAIGCSAAGPSKGNLALNDAVLGELRLPDGTARVARTDERQDVEGRYCIDITRLTLRSPGVDPSSVIPFLETVLEPGGWTLNVGDASGSGDESRFIASFERDDAVVTVTNGDARSDREYELGVSHPC